MLSFILLEICVYVCVWKIYIDLLYLVILECVVFGFVIYLLVGSSVDIC